MRGAVKDSAQMDLRDIIKGYPGLTPAQGATMLEACIVTLHRMGHKPGINLTIRGDKTEEIIITWPEKVTTQMQRAWRDQDVATEAAATCISILLALKFTGYQVIERSIKKTGFDYWLGIKEGESGDIFKRMARLEISGIFNDEKRLEGRTKEKLVQTKQSDASKLPAHIFVVEFSIPQCKFVSRK